MKPNARPIPIDQERTSAAAAELTKKVISVMKRRAGGVRLGTIVATTQLPLSSRREVRVEVVVSRVDDGVISGAYWPGLGAISIWIDAEAWLAMSSFVRQCGSEMACLRSSHRDDIYLSIGQHIESVLAHEVTHAVDLGLYLQRPAFTPGEGSKYYTSPSELAAFTQQIVVEVLQLAKTMKASEFESKRLYVEHMIERSFSMAEIEPHLDKDALNKIYKTVYQALVDRGYL